jgi:glucosamine 6-phosphate synthetase-like amidotransferase/phosphosugar isomerase protein
MALQHYVEFEVPDPSNLNRIESILNRNELEMEKAWIQTAYQDNLTALVNMKNKAIELLIIVQDVVGSSHPWYDFGTLVGLIHEYQKTLQKEKLSMLLVMLFLMICLKSQSPQIYEKAYGIVEQELNQLINFPQKGQSQQSIIIRIQDALKRDGYFHQAAAIMARIEQQRQMIDEVLEQKVA